MKLIDEKGRIGGKVSIVDLFVILLVAACVAAVGLKMKKSESVSGGNKTIVYEILIENVRDASVNAIKSNTAGIIDAESKKEIGDIADIDVNPARVLVQTNDGGFDIAEYDNRYDVTLTIESKGTETNDAYYTSSGKQISAGEMLNINNGYVQSYGEIISVTAE